MDQLRTPISLKKRRQLADSVAIPGSPAMSRIGMGTGVSVYSLVRSPRCGQLRSPWAIKRVNRRNTSPEYENRLVAEADILSSLNHPNIVGFRAFVEANDGRKCLAMEECETSLGELIEDRSEHAEGPFSVNAILTVAVDICKALCYLHNECFILHGDLKSFNVLIKGDFEVAKLCDFGVILRLDSNGVALSGQEYVGTECWCAPEIFEDEKNNITTKADIFSLGLILWEMLTLRVPHTTDDCSKEENEFCPEGSVLGDIGTRPELPSDLGSEYCEVVRIFEWCTEAVRHSRPSAVTLLQYLQTVQKE